MLATARWSLPPRPRAPTARAVALSCRRESYVSAYSSEVRGAISAEHSSRRVTKSRQGRLHFDDPSFDCPFDDPARSKTRSRNRAFSAGCLGPAGLEFRSPHIRLCTLGQGRRVHAENPRLGWTWTTTYRNCTEWQGESEARCPGGPRRPAKGGSRPRSSLLWRPDGLVKMAIKRGASEWGSSRWDRS